MNLFYKYRTIIILVICVFCILFYFIINYNFNIKKNIDYSININTKYSPEFWDNILKKIEKLSETKDADSVVLTVNDIPITKRDIEINGIISEIDDKSAKERFEILIEKKVLKAEAKRLNIKPSQKRIDEHIEQLSKALESGDDGVKPVLDYINSRKMTKDEYIAEQKELAYEMFEREAVWENAKASGKYKDYSEYTNELIKNADIKVPSGDI